MTSPDLWECQPVSMNKNVEENPTKSQRIFICMLDIIDLRNEIDLQDISPTVY